MTARTTTRSVSRRKSMSASATCLRMMSRASIVGVVTEILLVCWVMLSHEDDAVANRYPVDPLLTPRPGTLLTDDGSYFASLGKVNAAFEATAVKVGIQYSHSNSTAEDKTALESYAHATDAF